MFPQLSSDERSSLRQDNYSLQKLPSGRTLAHTHRFSTSLAVHHNVQPTFLLPMARHVMPTYISPHTSRCRHLTPRQPRFPRCSIYLVLRSVHPTIFAMSFRSKRSWIHSSRNACRCRDELIRRPSAQVLHHKSVSQSHRKSSVLMNLSPVSSSHCCAVSVRFLRPLLVCLYLSVNNLKLH